MDSRFARLIEQSSSLDPRDAARTAINSCPAAAWLDPKRFRAHVEPAVAAAERAELDTAADARAALDEAIDAA